MYSFVSQDNHEPDKAKDINKNVFDDKVEYEDYKNALFNRSYIRYDMNRTQNISK